MRFGSRVRLVVSAATACAFIALAAGSASAAKSAAPAGGSWGAGVEAVLPANAAVKDDGAGVGSISCPSPGDCTAVGSYLDSLGHRQGLLLTETAGRWAAGVEAVLPANADASLGIPAGASVGSVSCSARGKCSALGIYADSSGNQEGMLLTETAGRWSAGIEAALPANAASSHQLVQWGSLSCGSAGNCAAVGSYIAGPAGNFHALLLTETDGSWSAGVDAAPAPRTAWLSSVSCASAGNCTAVGTYVDSSYVQQGLLLTETAGSWGPPVEADLPADNSNTELAAGLDSVSCASAGNCAAVGLYDVGIVSVGRDEDEFRGKGLLLTETAGSWATGVGATLPAGADGSNAVSESSPSVACPSAGSCSVAGSYYDTTQSVQGVLLDETAGSWAAGTEALPATPPGNGAPDVGGPDAVSCASPGNCGALINGKSLLTETAGSWGSGVEPALPANAAPDSGFLLSSVACSSAAACNAVGGYTDSAGRQDGLLVGGSPASVSLQISKSGKGSGTVSGLPTGNCASTCSASFAAGASVTLTATPSPRSRFRGWSGGGCSGTHSCRPNTGVSDQTVTATFDLLPKCVVPRLQGMTLRAAKVAIRSHNCALGKVTHAASRRIAKGHVISQKPGQGRRLPHGAKVNLVVSRGRR